MSNEEELPTYSLEELQEKCKNNDHVLMDMSLWKTVGFLKRRKTVGILFKKEIDRFTPLRQECRLCLACEGIFQVEDPKIVKQVSTWKDWIK